nr:Hint domain-containing protein [Neokomagataea anthophila]
MSRAATVNATSLGKFTNNGTVKIVDNSGGGLTSNWGNGSDYFINNGSFSVDNSTATSGATFNLNFKGINNSGKFNLNIPQASTSIANVGSGGFVNTGVWKYSEQGNGGGNLQINGGNSNYINNGEIDVINGHLTLDNALVSSGAETGQVNLSQGSTVTLNGNNSGQGQVFNFNGGNNVLDVANGRTFVGVLRGFSQGDQFNIHIPGTLNYNQSTGILTITNAATVYSFDVGQGYTGKFSDSTNGVVTYNGATPCFLPGTMIRTGDTVRAIEEIKVGDMITVYDNGHIRQDSVTWVGSTTCKVRPEMTDDESGYPVRILKDAISDGVPFKDLLVTSEHCLFFEGSFVPARMLVNNRSIFYDKSFLSYDYYHVETENHSVIFADGVMTESYLDTGHRSLFHDGNISFIGYAPKSWETDASAPLNTTPQNVEPIFRSLEQKAIHNQLDIKNNPITVTQDPAVVLLTDNGVTLQSIREVDEYVVFMLPKEAQAVRILSRSSRPCDTIGPFWDDRRSFGVGISDIFIFEWNQKTNITTHLDNNTLEGWHDCDAGAHQRWTTGNAFLPLQRGKAEDHALLILRVQATDYVIEDACSDLRKQA